MTGHSGHAGRRRTVRRATTALALIAALAGIVVLAPAPAAKAAEPCTPVVHICPKDVGKDVLRGLEDTVIPGLAGAKIALEKIGAAAATAAEGLVAATLGWFMNSVVGTAQDILSQPGGFVDALTRPRLTAAAFLGPGGAYHMVASFGVVLLVGFIFLGVITGLLSGEPGQALFRIVRDTPAAVLAILGFPWLVEQLIAAADGLCAAVLPSGEVLRRLVDTHIFGSFDGLAVGLPQLLLALVAFAAAVLVFVELLVRNVLVHLTVALAPLSFAGIVWPAARPAARRVAELTVAGVLAKPAIYIALKVGLDLVGEFTDSGVPGGGAWGSLLLGIAVVCLAAFAPWIVWRLLPHAEAFLAAQGVSRMPARAGMQVLQTAYWVDMIRSRTGSRSRSGTAAGKPPASGGGLGPARRLPTPPPPGGGGRSPAPAFPTADAAAGGSPGGAAVSTAPAAGAATGRASSAGQRAAPAAGDAAGSGRPSDRPSEGWVRRPRNGARPGGAAQRDARS